MDKTTEEILRAINSRFPSGRHSTRILLMLQGDIGFDYDEVIRYLREIIDFGGSDRNYIDNNDKLDATLYITQLSEHINKII